MICGFADINIKLLLESEYIHRYFNNFKSDSSKIDLVIDFKNDTALDIVADDTTLIAVTDEHSVYMKDGIVKIIYGITDYVGEWIFYFDNSDGVYRAFVSLKNECENDKSLVCEEIFDTMKSCVFLLLQQKNKIALHSASIIYNDKVYLFSANSGVGKSTLTNNWARIIGSKIFNGDINIIGFENEKPIVYGIPWCGTSGLYNNFNLPLGGVCFVKRGKQNYCEELDGYDAVMGIIRHILSDNLIENDMDINIAAAEKIAGSTDVFAINCLPNDDAVFTVKNFIDNKGV